MRMLIVVILIQSMYAVATACLDSILLVMLIVLRMSIMKNNEYMILPSSL